MEKFLDNLFNGRQKRRRGGFNDGQSQNATTAVDGEIVSDAVEPVSGRSSSTGISTDTYWTIACIGELGVFLAVLYFEYQRRTRFENAIKDVMLDHKRELMSLDERIMKIESRIPGEKVTAGRADLSPVTTKKDKGRRVDKKAHENVAEEPLAYNSKKQRAPTTMPLASAAAAAKNKKRRVVVPPTHNSDRNDNPVSPIDQSSPKIPLSPKDQNDITTTQLPDIPSSPASSISSSVNSPAKSSVEEEEATTI